VDDSSFFPLILFFFLMAEDNKGIINEDWAKRCTSDQLLLA
jgi:hypothetical protein